MIETFWGLFKPKEENLTRKKMSMDFLNSNVTTRQSQKRRRRKSNQASEGQPLIQQSMVGQVPQTLGEPVNINVGKPVEEKGIVQDKKRIYLEKALSQLEELKKDIEAGKAVNAGSVIRKLARVEGRCIPKGIERYLWVN